MIPAAIALALALLPQETPAPQPGPPQARSSSRPFVDFDWLELTPRVGFAFFSEDFESDPSLSAGVAARAPMPWLSPASNPGGEYFGLFAGLSAAMIDREIEPEPDQPDGWAFFLSLGVDYTLFRDATWLLMAQAGGQYANYGGITDLEDGFGFVAGLAVGLNLAEGVALAYSPEFNFGRAGDWIHLSSIGFMIQF